MLRPAGKFSQPIRKDSPTTPSLNPEVRVVSQGKALARSATELLEDYVRTGSQAPFEEVVRRYAGMVFNVCYQILKDSHDAEDATQAVFLALAVQAKTTNGVKYLAPWLQKVAQRLSLDVRRSKTRRKAREERHSQMRLQMGIENDPTSQPGMDELKIILRDELDKLPSKYRLPLVLHYFGGLKPEEISKELGCKPSTLGVRLHRGRKMLADLLSERGIVVNGSMLSIALATCVQARISETLVHSTAHAAGAYAIQGSFSGAVAPQVMGFKQIASQGIFLAKVKAAVAAGILAAAAAAGAAELVNRVMPSSWRFDIRTELRDWLKPSFNSSAPELRVDAQSISERALAVDGGPIPFIGNNTFSNTTVIASPVSPQSTGPTSVAVGSANLTNTEMRDTPFGETASSSKSTGVALPTPVTRSAAGESDSPAIAGIASSNDVIVASASGSSGGGAGGGGSTSGVRGRTTLIAPPPSQVIHNPNGTGKIPQQPFMPKNSDTLSVASAAGQVQNYVLDKATRVSAKQFEVGGQGAASLSVQNGTISVSNTMTVGNAFGGSGAVTLDKTGTLYTPTINIGEDGKGTLSVKGNAQVFANNIVAGRNNVGVINITGGSIESRSLSVGMWNRGTVYQNGGVARSTNFLGNVGLAQLGVGATSEGTYYLNSGLLEAGKQCVGVAGYGHLYQTGGINSVQMLELGLNRGSSGSVQLPSGTLQFTRTQPDSPVPNQFIVGREGRGEVVVGSDKSEATITEVGYGRGTDLIVRADASGEGRLSGWGRVRLTGMLDQNGQIIADGFGQSRTLDLSTFESVQNSIDNPTDGANGWYARNGGALRLPINLAAARDSMLVDSYTFGESIDDQTIDLVNSARFVVNPKLDMSSPVTVSLISSDSEFAPGDRTGSFISMYETNFNTLPLESVEVSIRYDAAAAGSSTPHLVFWRDGAWQQIAAADVQFDPVTRVITATSTPSNFYAIAVPEPMTSALVAIGGTLMLRRRRV